MNFAQLAMQRMLIYYIIMLISLIILAISCFFKKSSKALLIGLSACAVLIVLFFLFIPFATDYSRGSIIEETGYYENKLAGKGNTSSDVLGIYSVTLQTKNKTIALTTAPGQNHIFNISGKHYVKAYYLPLSKILLHIEILGMGEENTNIIPSMKAK